MHHEFTMNWIFFTVDCALGFHFEVWNRRDLNTTWVEELRCGTGGFGGSALKIIKNKLPFPSNQFLNQDHLVESLLWTILPRPSNYFTETIKLLIQKVNFKNEGSQRYKILSRNTQMISMSSTCHVFAFWVVKGLMACLMNCPDPYTQYLCI